MLRIIWISRIIDQAAEYMASAVASHTCTIGTLFGIKRACISSHRDVWWVEKIYTKKTTFRRNVWC
jgi:hypothetical protein